MYNRKSISFLASMIIHKIRLRCELFQKYLITEIYKL